MKAWRVHEVGPPEEVLRLEDVAEPVPGPGEVVVDVDLAPLNFPDDLMIRGRYQIRPPLPFTPGLEVLGRLAGSRVVALTAMPAGGFAERALARSDDLFEVPSSIPDADAASLLITYQTAHVALHHRAGLQPGETLLVHAAAGVVGSAAVQLGAAAGALVIATAGGPEKVAVLRDLGAAVAVDYERGDFVQAVFEATDGRGADVVFDPVGGDVFDRSLKCLAWEGRILVVGFAGGRIADAPTNHALLKNYAVVGVHWGNYANHDREVMRAAHADLLRLHAEGLIRPLVHGEIPLERMPDALRTLVGRGTVGKVMVRP